MLHLDIVRETVEDTPNDSVLRRAAEHALELAKADPDRDWELCLYIVDRPEMQALNARYRGRDRPTNVLSFPAELPDGVDLDLLGDIAICAPIVAEEALAQGKSPEAHWDHMLIHGVLHLLGFDHESDAEAALMESLETRALATLGWPCPYEQSAATALEGAGR